MAFPRIKKGEPSEWVRQVQRQLIEAGYEQDDMGRRLVADGDPGSVTFAILELIRRRYSMTGPVKFCRAVYEALAGELAESAPHLPAPPD